MYGWGPIVIGCTIPLAVGPAKPSKNIYPMNVRSSMMQKDTLFQILNVWHIYLHLPLKTNQMWVNIPYIECLSMMGRNLSDI